MKHSNPNLQEQINNMDQYNLTDYMKLQGYTPTFENHEITVFAIRKNHSREIIITINNELNRLESVMEYANGNILDLASLIFDVKPDQILADPATYHLDTLVFRGEPRTPCNS